MELLKQTSICHTQFKESNQTVVVVPEAATIFEVLQILIEKRISSVPVLATKDGSVLGFVDLLDIVACSLQYFAEQHPKLHKKLHIPNLEKHFHSQQNNQLLQQAVINQFSSCESISPRNNNEDDNPLPNESYEGFSFKDLQNCMPFSSLNAGQIVNASGHNPFCPVPKNASLLDVAEIFVKFGVRRVPVSDGKSITKIITQTSIVSFLSDHVPVYIPSPSSVGAKDGSSVTSLVGSELSSNAGNSRSGSGSTTGCGGAMVASSISSSSYVVPRGLEVFSKTVSQLGISRKPLLITAKLSDPLYTAFKLIIQHNVSAIPILDDRKKLCATLSARDIHGICFNGLNLNLMFSSISQLLAALHHEEINVMNPTISCKESDVISSVVHKMKASKCHRIWIVNDQREVIGVVSLRDVLEAVSTDS